MHRIDMEVAL